MNKIKKYIIAAALIISVLLFAGCTEFLISASIDENNILVYSCKIDVKDIDVDDLNYMQVKGYFEKLQHHWKDNGYESDIFPYDGGISVYMEIQEQHETREEAFAALYGHMTNEISPFSNVDYDYNLNYYYEDYFIDAKLDFSQMIDSDIYDIYPDIVGKDVDEFLDSVKCTVEFSLPKNESFTTDIISENNKKYDISLIKESNISIVGIINNNANKVYEQDLDAKRNYEQKSMLIFFSVAFILIALLVLLIVFRVKKKKKPAADDANNGDIIEKEIIKAVPDTLYELTSETKPVDKDEIDN